MKYHIVISLLAILNIVLIQSGLTKPTNDIKVGQIKNLIADVANTKQTDLEALRNWFLTQILPLPKPTKRIKFAKIFNLILDIANGMNEEKKKLVKEIKAMHEKKKKLVKEIKAMH